MIDLDVLALFSTIATTRPISARHSKAAQKNMARTNQGNRKSPKWLRQLKHPGRRRPK